MGISKTSDHIQIKIHMPNPSQEPPVSSKAPNKVLKYIDVLFTFKIKITIKKLVHGWIRDQWPYPNQDQDGKPQWGLDLKHIDILCTYKINLDKKIWNLGGSMTSYIDFWTCQNSELFWAKLIWVKIKFESWASLSISQLEWTHLYWSWFQSEYFLADLS